MAQQVKELAVKPENQVWWKKTSYPLASQRYYVMHEYACAHSPVKKIIFKKLLNLYECFSACVPRAFRSQKRIYCSPWN